MRSNGNCASWRAGWRLAIVGSIYGTARWQRLRLAHLSLFPRCEACEASGKYQLAVAVDHRKPISDGGDPFPGHDGLASLCTACHSAKTARGVEAGAARTRKPRKGCNADGTPLDRRHPWHDGKKKSLRAARPSPRWDPNPELVQNLDDEVSDLWA